MGAADPMGDHLVVLFETDAPERLGREFGDSDYDRWWTKRVEALHGFDPRSVIRRSQH